MACHPQPGTNLQPSLSGSSALHVLHMDRSGHGWAGPRQSHQMSRGCWRQHDPCTTAECFRSCSPQLGARAGAPRRKRRTPWVCSCQHTPLASPPSSHLPPTAWRRQPLRLRQPLPPRVGRQQRRRSGPLSMLGQCARPAMRVTTRHHRYARRGSTPLKNLLGVFCGFGFCVFSCVVSCAVSCVLMDFRLPS